MKLKDETMVKFITQKQYEYICARSKIRWNTIVEKGISIIDCPLCDIDITCGFCIAADLWQRKTRANKHPCECWDVILNRFKESKPKRILARGIVMAALDRLKRFVK